MRATPSFIDLRDFAADETQGIAGAASSGDAFLDDRRLLDLPKGPVTVGAVRLDPSAGRVSELGGDEYIIVVSGSFGLETESGSLHLAAGQSAVLPQGSSFSWTTQEATSLLFMRHEGSGPGASAPLLIDESAELSPSGAPLAELLVGPTPQCRNHTDYKSESGEFMCGVWDSTPYHRRAMGYRHYELMHLLEGSVTFEDGIGRRATFNKGDIFLIEQGAHCSWLSEVQVAKVYAIYRPA
ncbi:enzyme of the cupin superfamily [Sphingomonas oleivorans]|uniref:Enzyme of the cupin superfamily n=1 Tax=Sphingomonas oleivorans TaxID=1735121 RepID=A0A2T5G2Z5_9SPHN|nr:enzyme of the cupin superfamily [Sphingomonas oleivorans]